MFEYYSFIKHLHMSTAALSVAFFALRGGWTMLSPQMLERRWVRIAPHVIDTVLLLSALTLAALLISAGASYDWMLAKVGALVAYIALGTIALKRGRAPAIRMAALLAALGVIAYIFAVAFSKQPFPFG